MSTLLEETSTLKEEVAGLHKQLEEETERRKDVTGM